MPESTVDLRSCRYCFNVFHRRARSFPACGRVPGEGVEQDDCTLVEKLLTTVL